MKMPSGQRDFQALRRSSAFAENGMAATSHTAATLTALDILRQGGNAMDAAIAAVAVQCVVEPGQTGIGGDCFALWSGMDGKVRALNASGRSPAASDAQQARADLESNLIPSDSHYAVTIPGAVAGWQALLDTAGSMSLRELLQPAIRFARDGFLLTPRIANDWRTSEERLRRTEATEKLYLPKGTAPVAGDRHVFPQLAATLEAIGKDGASAFYEGALAESMVKALRAEGGLHAIEDFASYRPEFVEPISTNYRGVDVFECPPNGQGIIALLMLNMLKEIAPTAGPADSVQRYHVIAEATKLAFRERDRWLADPDCGDTTMDRLLESGVASELASMIDLERALAPLPSSPIPAHRDTVYLTVVDRERNVVSLINSLFEGFGSGIACPETGVLFHCRGRAFTLEDGHPNQLKPKIRPAHTIIPGLTMQGGKPLAGFGVMGGDFQPIGHAQVMSNVVDFGMDPQAAIDQPRVMAYPGPALSVELGINESTRQGLAALGHTIEEASAPHGGGQMILIDHERGVLIGGSEPRKDGIALGY